MLEILLVFSMNYGPIDVSDRIFYSYQECAEFVNAIAKQEVVRPDYNFQFIASDGATFVGQCIDKYDWAKGEKI